MKVNEILTESTAPAFDGNFPIAMKAVEGSSSARYATKLKADVDVIKAAFAAGEIINTQVQPIKDHINYFVKAAFDAAIDWDELRGDKEEQFHEIYGALSCWDLRGMASSYKKLVKVSAASKATKVYKVAVELCEELMPLVKVMDHIKAITVKASVKKAEAKAAKNAETETYNKKFTDHKDVKKVVNLLKGQASAIEKELYETQLKYLNRIVADYQKHLKDGKSDYMEIYEKNPQYKFTIQGLVKRVYSKDYSMRAPKVFELEKDWKAKIDESAKKTAADIVDHFVYKNSGKLSYIIFNKNNLKEVTLQNVTVGRGAVEAQLHLVFADKSEFVADSSVVFAVSVLGKPFYRYPTIFKNVKLPDGSRLGQPSEQRMDEIFAVTK